MFQEILKKESKRGTHDPTTEASFWEEANQTAMLCEVDRLNGEVAELKKEEELLRMALSNKETEVELLLMAEEMAANEGRRRESLLTEKLDAALSEIQELRVKLSDRSE